VVSGNEHLLMGIIQIRDAVGNEYGRPKDVVGEQRMAFTSHADAHFDVCFENYLSGSTWATYLLFWPSTNKLKSTQTCTLQSDTSNSISILVPTQRIGRPCKLRRN
jgi:hypothetical protein